MTDDDIRRQEHGQPPRVLRPPKAPPKPPVIIPDYWQLDEDARRLRRKQALASVDWVAVVVAVVGACLIPLVLAFVCDSCDLCR